MKFITAVRLSKKLHNFKKWGLGRSPKRGEGGSPTLNPGTDAGRVCTRALHDAKPTKHTQPFTGERGLGMGVENKHFFEKTDFFYKLTAVMKREVHHSRCFMLIYQLSSISASSTLIVFVVYLPVAPAL